MSIHLSIKNKTRLLVSAQTAVQTALSIGSRVIFVKLNIGKNMKFKLKNIKIVDTPRHQIQDRTARISTNCCSDCPFNWFTIGFW